jgi:hypothetical protein
MEKARKITLSGSVAKIDEVCSANYQDVDNDSTIVTLETADGNVDLWFNDNMVDEFNLKSILFFDNAITVDVEERIAFVTGYSDEDGDHFHGEKNNETPGVVTLAVLNAAHQTTAGMVRSGLSLEYAKLVAELRKENAVATIGKNRFYASKKEVTSSDIPAEIERLERKLALATGPTKDQIANVILELKKEGKKEAKNTTVV